jgi:hypothetical protein
MAIPHDILIVRSLRQATEVREEQGVLLFRGTRSWRY